MLLSTTMGRILKSAFNFNQIIDILAEAGFDAIDFSFFAFAECYNGTHGKDFYTELKKYAENKGLVFNQAHGPFPSSFIDENETEKRFEEIVESIKVSSFLGVKNIIIHPCQHLPYRDNKEYLFENNMNFYKRLIPYSEEYGVKIALENMWQYQKEGYSKIVHSTCATPKEFVRYLDELKSECFVACLDVGHATVVGEELDNFVKALGSKRLKALHVHDVDGIHDNHTLPFFGITDWDAFMKSLSDIGYTGDFTYEADCFMNGKPASLLPECERLMEKTGRYLINKFEDFKKGNM